MAVVGSELSDDCLDPSDTRSGTFLFLDLESLDVSGVRNVRSTAEFCGDVSDPVDFDDCPVLVIEDSDGSGCLRLIDGHLLTYDRDVPLNGVVDECLDGLQLLGGEFPVEVEVEPEPVRSDVTSLLPDVGIDELPECGIEEVSCGVELGGLLAVVGKASLEGLFGSCPGFLLVGAEPVLEVLHVDGESLLCSQLCGELDRESEGIVEPEDELSVHDLLLTCVSDHLVEAPESLDEGRVELLFLRLDVAADVVLLPGEFGVCGTILVTDLRTYPVHEDVIVSEFGHVPGGTPDESPQDVSLSDLCGNDTVSEDEGGCPEVVCDDPEVPDRISLVLASGDVLELGDDSGEEAGVIDGLLTLGDTTDPLESHSRVDVLLCEGFELSLVVLEVLHEDVVPDLGVLSAVAGWSAIGSALGLSVVEEDLGVGSAGSGDSSRSPPVVLPSVEEDLVIPHSVGPPDRCGLLVTGDALLSGECGDCKLVVGESKVLGEEFVTECDGFLLEVVSKGPVSEHLEECEVAVISDLIDVSGPDALLEIHKPLSHGVFLSEEIGDERVHTCSGEQNGRIVLWNE